MKIHGIKLGPKSLFYGVLFTPLTTESTWMYAPWVLEALREFAELTPVHVSLREDEMISALEDWRSSGKDDSLYDLTKRLQETIAKDYCETHGMTTIVLGAGHIVDGRSETDLKGRPFYHTYSNLSKHV